MECPRDWSCNKKVEEVNPFEKNKFRHSTASGNKTLPLYSQNKRGVAILINEHLPFILEHEESDPEGRFILRTGSIFKQFQTNFNVFALKL